MPEYIEIKIPKKNLENHVKRICRSNLKRPAKICQQCPFIEPVLEIMNSHGWEYKKEYFTEYEKKT